MPLLDSDKRTPCPEPCTSYVGARVLHITNTDTYKFI